MAVLDEMSSLPVSSIHANGDLRLVQQTLLAADKGNTMYNKPLVNYTLATAGPNTAALKWSMIMSSYQDRDCEV
jgi:hypothetical protein